MRVFTTNSTDRLEPRRARGVGKNRELRLYGNIASEATPLLVVSCTANESRHPGRARIVQSCGCRTHVAARSRGAMRHVEGCFRARHAQAGGLRRGADREFTGRLGCGTL